MVRGGALAAAGNTWSADSARRVRIVNLVDMSPTGVPRAGRRARSQRAHANDERILDAAVDVLRLTGWDSVTVAAVAARSRLTATPVTTRFADLSALGAAVWSERVGHHALEMLTDVMEAVHSQDSERLLAVMNTVAYPSADLVAAADLLLAAQFDPRLGEVVHRDVRSVLSPHCEPSASVTKTQAAQSVYGASLALGLVLMWPRTASTPIDITAEVAKIGAALRNPSRPRRLPSVSADDVSPLAVTGVDGTLSDLHAATLLEVGLRGFRGATLQRIAATAQVSQGLIFARYSSKLDLFIDATARRHASAYQANAERWATVMDTMGAGCAEATMIKTFLQPGLDALRALALEQERLAWFDVALQASLTKAISEYLERTWEITVPEPDDRTPGQLHLDLALGAGVLVVPRLLPDAWRLPFDVVTVPLLG